jgi:hypothetical protein
MHRLRPSFGSFRFIVWQAPARKSPFSTHPAAVGGHRSISAKSKKPFRQVSLLVPAFPLLAAMYPPVWHSPVPLPFQFAFTPLSLRPSVIIRFSHGASSSNKVYRSSFIPGLHDVCMVFERP